VWSIPLASSIAVIPLPRFFSSRFLMACEGTHMAFFFILLRRVAISYSVSLFHGSHLVPGSAPGGGAVKAISAFEVLIPATAECAFVPEEPGRRTRGGFCDASLGSVAGLGGFGVFGSLPAALMRLRDLSWLGERGGGEGEGEKSDGGGESGFGGGRTSPGTTIF
jgi:hypothetical protein